MAPGDTRVLQFQDPTTGFLATVTTTETEIWTLSFDLEVDESTGVTGDVRAVYLKNTGDAFY